VTTTLYAVNQTNESYTVTDFALMILVKFVFAINALLFTYLVSKMFPTPAAGFIQVFIVNQILGPAAFFTCFGLKIYMRLEETARVFRKIFVAFPYFNLCDSILKLLSMHDLIEICAKQCPIFGICTKEDQCLNNELCCGESK
jgi:hypothetical protein